MVSVIAMIHRCEANNGLGTRCPNLTEESSHLCAFHASLSGPWARAAKVGTSHGWLVKLRHPLSAGVSRTKAPH
jgi:hypothetical protein